MADHHTFVLKIEDGFSGWSLICPDDDSCTPVIYCGGCGRDVHNEEAKPCYDCPTPEEASAEECWAQTWVGELTADEVLRGTVEVKFPVTLEWNGDGLEAYVAGPAVVGGDGA